MENLPAIKKESFIERIKKNFRKIFGINQEEHEQSVYENKPVINKTNFKDEIKFEEDLSKKKLLEIQKKLEEGGITLELACELTKDLTSSEKSDLLYLYKLQINDLEKSLKNYKSKILAIKNKINT